MSVYLNKPTRFLELIIPDKVTADGSNAFCAGFEFKKWRCKDLAFHLLEWLPDYALSEDVLTSMSHANALKRLREAAERVYSTHNFEKRGEVGEIAAHAICRDFFETIPISPRVYYKSSSNEIIKGFDLVHARTSNKKVEIWFGEAKTYKDRADAISAAIKSVNNHLKAGFLKSQKLLLGPQIPLDVPNRDQLAALFEANTSLDKLVDTAVFPIFILANSEAVAATSEPSDQYSTELARELGDLSQTIKASAFNIPIRVPLIYVPLASKDQLLEEFDKRLKGIQ